MHKMLITPPVVVLNLIRDLSSILNYINKILYEIFSDIERKHRKNLKPNLPQIESTLNIWIQSIFLLRVNGGGYKGFLVNLFNCNSSSLVITLSTNSHPPDFNNSIISFFSFSIKYSRSWKLAFTLPDFRRTSPLLSFATHWVMIFPPSKMSGFEIASRVQIS